MIYAMDVDETNEFLYEGVKWHIKALPFEIKKKVTAETQGAVMGTGVIDFAELALLTVKYGLDGWEGLKYRDGTEAVCVKEKDKNGENCLNQATLEMLYRTSVFDKIAQVVIDPSKISEYMKKAVEFDNKESKDRGELEGNEKK